MTSGAGPDGDLRAPPEVAQAASAARARRSATASRARKGDKAPTLSPSPAAAGEGSTTPVHLPQAPRAAAGEGSTIPTLNTTPHGGADHGDVRHLSGGAHGSDAHPHARRDDVARRLARAAGHLEAVRRMVDADRDCPEILRQVAAVRAALDAAARVVLADHMESCLRGAAQGEPDRAWDDLKAALETFIR